jgi:N-acetylglutamate synthase-like GNAT family acetyltransferase
MRIRRLTINDYEAITELWKRAKLSFRPKGRESRDAISKEMAANPEFFLGAFEQDCLIGVAIISCDMRKGWINRLAVDPRYRHGGVAKVLIAESERVLRTRGIRLFCALIDADNMSSKELFRKCGYVEHHDMTYFSKRDDEDV